MICKLKRGIAILLAVALPAQALAAGSCWTRDQVRAAEVNDVYTIAMTGALLCRNQNASIWPRYVAFLGSKRAALGQMNARLRHHFAEALGSARARDAVDSYGTKVGNRYGAGVIGMGCSDIAALIDAGVAAAPTMQALIDLAERRSSDPLLDAPRCDALTVPLQTASLSVSSRIVAVTAPAVLQPISVSETKSLVPRLEVAMDAIAFPPQPVASASAASDGVARSVTLASATTGNSQFPR